MQDGTAQLRIRRLSNFAANGLPVGFEYFTINKNIRTGSLPLLGGLYSRELYADLWSWIQEQPGYLITETEWQSKSQANNGNVPFYSSGDGSATFRVPSLKCWVKSGSEITEVGSYLAAGLPNITGEINPYTGLDTNESGVFTTTVASVKGPDSADDIANKRMGFDASLSNPIYGNSDAVTPESIVGLYCVIAFSTISNTGNLDVQTLYNKIIDLENKLENVDATPVGTILPFSGNTIPEGFLECNGAGISATTYAALYGVIGNTYGGDSTTFNLPNIANGKLVTGGVSKSGRATVYGNGQPFGLTQNGWGLSHFQRYPTSYWVMDNTSQGGTGVNMRYPTPSDSAAKTLYADLANVNITLTGVNVKYIIKY